ncbi:uncharacterized protein Z518_07821 [Rhinocladiella mackenziei CBS 650.93]|uniref:Rhinocladiella mackenziei CBS 650.93 unplaced genomic scaffold supercont1.6, whole genome shotgun sequence n=1 Tax=Rhinocladiella mackenziei CBS 650.93 TaxID=1442369 RepID=A0A0D2FIN4_9EURO|nr:uncharacterized protein Z518_07821 [Rhinocladiella mackenziei CBS 650.93]KIX01882.1 hypothetical protein Z518_07821 [Rhinocladiella mackenziei CBS 650.93]
MAFTGTNAFGNLDYTAQVAGTSTNSLTQHRERRDDATSTSPQSLPDRVSREDGSSRAQDVIENAASDTATATPNEDKGADATRDDDAKDLERRDSLVQELAHFNGSVFAAHDPDSPLNPNCFKFNARAWAKALVNLVAADGVSFRTSGVCFQDLNVFGYSAGTDYQKDVANVWLEATGLVRRVIGYGRRRIDILRNFDGVLHKGEMLVVLGPSGAGCTTLLKTIAAIRKTRGSAPQSAYDLFDKALVLYEGRKIFFGRAHAARQYFIDLGFECPARQTSPDFLTSMTSPQERIIRPGFEDSAPRTPDEFATAWRNSAAHRALRTEIEEYKIAHPLNGSDAEAFQQAKGQRAKSPYTLSYPQQIGLCLWRAYRRLIGDPSLTVGQLTANIIMGLIVSSVYYNLQLTTGSFF